MDDEVEALSGSEWWRLRMGLGKRRPGSGLDEDWTSRVGEGEVVRLRGVHEEVNYRGVGTRGNVTDSEA